MRSMLKGLPLPLLDLTSGPGQYSCTPEMPPLSAWDAIPELQADQTYISLPKRVHMLPLWKAALDHLTPTLREHILRSAMKL